MIYKKGEEVPRGWYEITRGRDENPFFLLRFYQDCEEVMGVSKRYLRTVSGSGYAFEVFNCDSMDIRFIIPIHISTNLEVVGMNQTFSATPIFERPNIDTCGSYPNVGA